MRHKTHTAGALEDLAQVAERIAARHYESNARRAAEAKARGDYARAAKYTQRANRHAANLEAMRGHAHAPD